MPDLFLDADRAAAGGHELADAGAALLDLFKSTGAEIAAMSGARPWGNDDIGQAFERNYRPVEAEFLQAWEALSRHVEGLGDAMVKAVREATQTDVHAAVRVQRTYGQRQ
ncbi:hypothetical protein [Actinoplanes sp. TFC3]|uniref:hypothetical protein n=1 Tax=Actinoplanes sp. TFC3 TaxID=1710355 RepID=UPI00082D99EC|nr:hypothetical protein [Actinoplanes sp. TFC3]